MELQQERVIRAKALGFFKDIKPNSFHREGCLGSDLLGSNDAGPTQRLGGACLDFQGNLPLELQFLWLSMQSAVSGSLSATTSSAKSPRETAPSTKITGALPNVRQAVVPGSCGAESVRAHTLVFFGVSLLNPDLGGCQLVWMLLVVIVWMLLATRRGEKHIQVGSRCVKHKIKSDQWYLHCAEYWKLCFRSQHTRNDIFIP